jgi:hypothetical protein
MGRAARGEGELTMTTPRKKKPGPMIKRRRAPRGIDALMGAMAAAVVAEGVRRRQRATFKTTKEAK